MLWLGGGFVYALGLGWCDLYSMSLGCLWGYSNCMVNEHVFLNLVSRN